MEQLQRMIEKEWQMFSSVNEGYARASCQEDPETFFAMRRAQFSAWSEEVCLSYEQDLDEAKAQGRNLAEEKYIRMMAVTDPERYLCLCHRLPPVAEQTGALAEQINDILLRQTAQLRTRYPFLSKIGRPLYAADADMDDTSIETYQLGELMTYSHRTLALLDAHVRQLDDVGISLAERIQLNSLRCIGFSSFEEAEKAVRLYPE